MENNLELIKLNYNVNTAWKRKGENDLTQKDVNGPHNTCKICKSSTWVTVFRGQNTHDPIPRCFCVVELFVSQEI